MIQDSWFDQLDVTSPEEITRRFAPFVLDTLHPYLNSRAGISDIQGIRLGWKSRTGFDDAFGSFKADPRHWYTFNHGGRAEAQFNIGMFPSHVRVGLGFEFTEKQGGDPSAVTLSYAVFRQHIASSAEFARFAAANQIEIEFAPTADGGLGFAPTSQVQSWEPPPYPPIHWIFCGRLLRRGQDRDVLEDREAFGCVLKSVLGGFKPFWRKAQEQAAAFR